MKLQHSLTLAVWLAASAMPALAEQPTLELIMSDPDWIGNGPEQPYWADDGQSVYYEQKRQSESIRDLVRVGLDGATPEVVDLASLPRDAGVNRVYNRNRSAVAWVHFGDILLKNLGSGGVRRVTHSEAVEAAPQFSADGQQLQFERDGQFFAFDRRTGITTQITDIRLGKDPAAAPAFEPLRQQQTAYSTVAEDARREHDRETEQRRRSGLPLPVYLAQAYEIESRYLSTAGNVLALVVTAKQSEPTPSGKMPNYVTADGRVEIKEVRNRVEHNAARPQQVLLVDLPTGKVQKLDVSELPSLASDPYEQLRGPAQRWYEAAGADAKAVEAALRAPKLRSVQVEAASWSPDGKQLALQLMATDFKDRWLVTVAGQNSQPRVQHHLSDEAWINWDYNEFGWLPDSQSLWYLSEESGYSHLYRTRIDERGSNALTSGNFVVREPAIDPHSEFAYVVANRAHPGNYEVYRVPLTGGKLETVTDLDGVSSFQLSPDGSSLLVSRSWFDHYPELYVTDSAGEAPLQQLTHTVSERYEAIDWVIPEIVEVPSSHTRRPIYSKLYKPRDFTQGQKFPAVMFVHGAGYTQNAHMGWPYYFREFMFHTLLANSGYVVLDMDYRASKGYGRDWRTSIYRRMGEPELEDYLDGVEYLVAQQQVDRARIGIYGGSYGGFMTFMALFKAPETFAAGAALRPVADWMHYENDYTSRILNTPLVDPEAYQRSSPINHAQGLQKPLLIASGMQDDNVFFQDSVLMVQRLIELKKENFEIAIYPLDGHGFTHPDSWLDEYRRIFKLMESHVKQ